MQVDWIEIYLPNWLDWQFCALSIDFVQDETWVTIWICCSSWSFAKATQSWDHIIKFKVLSKSCITYFLLVNVSINWIYVMSLRIKNATIENERSKRRRAIKEISSAQLRDRSLANPNYVSFFYCSVSFFAVFSSTHRSLSPIDHAWITCLVFFFEITPECVVASKKCNFFNPSELFWSRKETYWCNFFSQKQDNNLTITNQTRSCISQYTRKLS